LGFTHQLYDPGILTLSGFRHDPDPECSFQVEAPAEKPQPGTGSHGNWFPGDPRGVHAGLAFDNLRIARDQLPGAYQEDIAHLYRIDGDVLKSFGADPMSSPGRRCLQLTHGVGCAAFGVPLQGLASRLHHHDDQPGERLAQQQRGDNREHRDQVRRKPAGCDAAHRPPDHRSASNDEAGIPEDGGRRLTNQISNAESREDRLNGRGRKEA
jgi:hypothetical protein